MLAPSAVHVSMRNVKCVRVFCVFFIATTPCPNLPRLRASPLVPPGSSGDEGGIVCHIAPPDKEEALVVSLTQVRVPRSMPLAAAVADYHNHRVKKLKKQRMA